jgi:hypothetical protein
MIINSQYLQQVSMNFAVIDMKRELVHTHAINVLIPNYA